MDRVVEFISKQGPKKSGDVARVKQLARELAKGVHDKLWQTSITHNPSYGPNSDELQSYFCKRWKEDDFEHLVNLLRNHGYVVYDNSYKLATTAFKLLEDVEPYNVFISYKRSESSALALLALARLKEHSLIPFVDMALEAGGNWHADLEERIKACDYFIILLGKETLSSDMTVKEIGWALRYQKTIIPLWHSGFDLNEERWADIDQEVKDSIQQTNAIRVTDESASGYNAAIVDLLNRFGITP